MAENRGAKGGAARRGGGAAKGETRAGDPRGGQDPERDPTAREKPGDHRGEKPPRTVEEADRLTEEKRRRLENLIRRQQQRGQNGRDWKGDVPHATPWLIIRYSLTDLGARPIPSSQAHWKSPDIWIESSDPNGNGVAGEENFVHARIFNLGMAGAVPVQVDFYWADPSVGLGPSAMNFIGTEWVAVNSIGSVDVRCNKPWIPVFLNNGHECLMVNCSNHILDPIINPFMPRIDRHVGQSNVTVLQGSVSATIEFVFTAANIFGLATTLDFHATVERLRYDPKLARKLPFRTLADHATAMRNRHVESGPEIATRYQPGTVAYRSAQRIARLAARRAELGPPPANLRPILGGASPRLKADFSETLGVQPPRKEGGEALLAREFLARDLMVQGAECAPAGAVVLAEGIGFRGYEARRVSLEMTIPADAKDGDLLLVDLSQRALGMVTGGYTVVVRVTP